MNEHIRLRYTNQIVGIFLLIVLVLFMILSVVVLRAGNFLVKEDEYWFQVPQIELDGIRVGTEVTMLGKRIGQVSDMQYVNDGNQVRVDITVAPEFGRQIFASSVVKIERKFGVATPMLSIHRQANTSGELVPLPPGSQLLRFVGEVDRVQEMSQEVAAVSEAIKKIEQQLSPTLIAIEAAAEQLNTSLTDSVDPSFADSQRTFDSIFRTSEELRPETLTTLSNFRDATASVESSINGLTQKIGTIVDADLRDTLAEVQRSADELSRAAQTIAQTSKELNADMTKTLAQTRDAIEQAKRLTQETREVMQIVRGEANEFPGTAARINDTADDTQQLISELRGSWLLRRNSVQRDNSEAVPSSGVRGGLR